MGRFDALTQLEKPIKVSTPPLVVIPPVNSGQSNAVKVQSSEPKKSTKPQVHLPTNQSPALEPIEKPEKYTTHLEPSLIKKLKLHATERDLKDYQVIKNALLLYFAKNK